MNNPNLSFLILEPKVGYEIAVRSGTKNQEKSVDPNGHFSARNGDWRRLVLRPTTSHSNQTSLLCILRRSYEFDW